MAIKILGPLFAATWLAVSPLGVYAQTNSKCGFGMCGTSALLAIRPTWFSFEIEPTTPVKNLLPLPPLQAPPRPPWLVNDIGAVPEIFFQKPVLVRRFVFK